MSLWSYYYSIHHDVHFVNHCGFQSKKDNKYALGRVYLMTDKSLPWCAPVIQSG